MHVGKVIPVAEAKPELQGESQGPELGERKMSRDRGDLDRTPLVPTTQRFHNIHGHTHKHKHTSVFPSYCKKSNQKIWQYGPLILICWLLLSQLRLTLSNLPQSSPFSNSSTVRPFIIMFISPTHIVVKKIKYFLKTGPLYSFKFLTCPQ